jgi:UDP-3-O-[3-hydroxymyristoyl] glucosamine N-acyltransferase
MRLTVEKLANALGAEADGATDLPIARPRHPAEAEAGDIALAMDQKYAASLGDCKAKAAILWPGADWRALGLEAAIFVGRPRYAMAGVTAAFQHPIHAPEGVHPSAIVDPAASIGPGASVGPFVWIGPRARVGAGARILAGASVGEDAELGDDALIQSGVRIGARVSIGDRVIIHQNAVIGADGFSFVTPERGSVESAKETGAVKARNTAFARIHSLAAVTIGDDVEIGAGATLDRGTLSDTRVGDGTKIDNQVQVGHNVRIGRGCLLCAHVGVAGSAVIGDRVVLGGKVGVADHLKIGDDSVIAAASAVATNVPKGSVLMGVPALPRDETMKILLATRRLPRILDKLKR